jgi:uncharacterized protein YjlB
MASSSGSGTLTAVSSPALKRRAKVTVTGADGETAKVGQGDLVTFPAGMSCKWKISRDVKKHYRFG